jgi:hypothetical protein
MDSFRHLSSYDLALAIKAHNLLDIGRHIAACALSEARKNGAEDFASYAVAESRVGTWETVGEIVGCFGLDVLLQEKELRLAAGVAVAYLRGTVG